MATKNARYMVTVDHNTEMFLKGVSEKKHQSISGLIMELIGEAIELRDDYYLSKLAEKVEKRSEGKKRIPADVLWKELDLQ